MWSCMISVWSRGVLWGWALVLNINIVFIFVTDVVKSGECMSPSSSFPKV